MNNPIYWLNNDIACGISWKYYKSDLYHLTHLVDIKSGGLLYPRFPVSQGSFKSKYQLKLDNLIQILVHISI